MAEVDANLRAIEKGYAKFREKHEELVAKLDQLENATKDLENINLGAFSIQFSDLLLDTIGKHKSLLLNARDGIDVSILSYTDEVSSLYRKMMKMVKV
ncbi:hypothetical protein [Desulfovibrio gilichinskyi]|uniref:Uncharacterized protein n=1 Tax=Desulfovibrio gilichinskyi TaxID=1519643 RepID=A0A1X7C0Y1_9BACT|nr:hypothetical protein [Desulfovibrio gilichinskyi]SME87842.1 hypothetical protein SAMN06295933_0054 [Desulfovibrio gilichinskyi]